MPLEALWWAEDLTAFVRDDRTSWQWTAMIAQPDRVDAGSIAAASEKLRAKKDLPALAVVRLERFTERRAAQILHVGPYSSEGPTIAAPHEFIESQGYALAGKHHEIYLSDPSRTAPEKLKTIIRQPFALL